jgi:hypothetical protein
MCLPDTFRAPDADVQPADVVRSTIGTQGCVASSLVATHYVRVSLILRTG